MRHRVIIIFRYAISILRYVKFKSTQSIKLTSDEKHLIEILQGFVKMLREDSGKMVRLYFVGGWVRDKLLGKESNDIDIAIDGDITGPKFAILLKQYAESIGVDVSGMGMVRANPEQSKHLETATMMILGVDIDLVPMRIERYGDTRIPDIEKGTIQDDAERRDLTICAIFYDIENNQIVDPVGGLWDICSEVIRTPIDPLQTFLDDPLRILRAIRFSIRFGFRMDPRIRIASMKVIDRNMLSEKVSRERIGIEVKKILSGPDPIKGLRLLNDFSLFGTVFQSATITKQKTKDESGKTKEIEMFGNIRDAFDPDDINNAINFTNTVLCKLYDNVTSDEYDELKFIATLSCMLLYSMGQKFTTFTDPKKKSKDTNVSWVESIVKSLKLPNDTSRDINAIVYVSNELKILGTESNLLKCFQQSMNTITDPNNARFRFWSLIQHMQRPNLWIIPIIISFEYLSDKYIEAVRLNSYLLDKITLPLIENTPLDGTYVQHRYNAHGSQIADILQHMRGIFIGNYPNMDAIDLINIVDSLNR